MIFDIFTLNFIEITEWVSRCLKYLTSYKKALRQIDLKIPFVMVLVPFVKSIETKENYEFIFINCLETLKNTCKL